MIRQLFKTVRDKLHSLAKFTRKPQQLPDHHHAKPVEESPLPERKRVAKPRKERPRWSLEQFPVAAQEGKTRFHDLKLPLGLMHAIADLDFQYCSPIQAEALPATLRGQDLVGQAQTGTGKTAAFLIAILAQLQRQAPSGKRPAGMPKALILAPTRELAIQIAKDARALSTYMRVQSVEIFGGADYRKQQAKLQGVVDIVVATPGRLLDFHRQKIIKFDEVQFLVIDEADRLLDMGFIPDVKQIVYSTPHKDKRQTLFFSATFTEDVKRLAEQWTREPLRVSIEPQQVASDSIEQKVFIVTSEEKYPLLYNLITQQNLQRVMVFSNYRHETRSLNDRLRRDGIRCAMLSGDVPQNKRSKTLEDFRNGKIRVLVATDVAARGIHVEGVSHVVNFNLPQDPEDYVHRIGRTGRAGEKGISVSFACEEDSFYIPDIQAFLGEELKCEQPDAGLLKAVPKSKAKSELGAANLQISPAAAGGVLADLEVSHSQQAEPTPTTDAVDTPDSASYVQQIQTQSPSNPQQPRRRRSRSRHLGQRHNRHPSANTTKQPAD